MKVLAVLVGLVLAAPSWAEELPTVISEAVQWELQGRLGEALEQYRSALSSETIFVQDEALALPLTIRVYSKAAHLSIDLGYGEEAWDLAGRLLLGKNPSAVAAGTLVRMRLLRLQGKGPEALSLYNGFLKTGLGPDLALATEAKRIRSSLNKPSATVDSEVGQATGPWAWVNQGDADLLSSPTEALGLKVQENTRLQVGAFKDWNRALTLVDILREKGWSPFTDVKLNAAGEKLHLVYVISRQPEADRARLEAEGLK